MRNIFLLVVLCLISVVGYAQSESSVPVCGLNNNTTAYIPGVTPSGGSSNYATFTPPSAGNSYVDGLTGCTVTRITGTANESIYYSTLTPFSGDDKFLLVGAALGSFEILTAPAYEPTYTPGTVVVTSGNMPGALGNDAKWDYTNPDVLYYASGNSLMSATITGLPGCIAGHTCTITSATVHQFAEYSSIYLTDEPDITQDGLWVPFVGFTSSNSRMALALWKLSPGTKNVVYTTTCTGSPGIQPGCVHKIQVTPDDGLVVTYTGNGTSAETGTWYYPGNLSTAVNIQNATNHVDTGYDKSSNPMFVQDRLDSSKGTDPCPSMGGADLSKLTSPVTGGVCLLDKNWAQPEWSYRRGPTLPWVVMSFFDTRSQGPEWFSSSGNYVAPTVIGVPYSGTGWFLYEGEILMVPIDNANTSTYLYRLAQGRSRSEGNGAAQDFWSVPIASASHDANYVAFQSNMAYPSGSCSSPNISGCADVYVISAAGGGPLFSAATKPNPPTGLNAIVH